MASPTCTCSNLTHRYSFCSLHSHDATAAAAGSSDGEAGAGAAAAAGQASGMPSNGEHHPLLGTVAWRALFSSKNRRGGGGGGRRRARSKDAGSLPSRLSKMTVAEEVDD